MPPERAAPPLALGSKIAKVRGKSADAIGDAPQPACAAVPAGAPEAMTAALVKACAGGTKPVAGQTVTVKDTDAGATIALSATRGCYRVLAAAPPAIESYVVDVLDSRGGLAAEGRSSGRALVVPAEGPLCFEADDAAKIVVSAGRGAGPISVQITRE